MQDPSPFAPHLGTNYGVSGDEAKRLVSYLAESIARLAELKEELKNTQTHYNAVLKEYHSLSQSVNEHQALMAPIRQLPVDAIQEIFMHCLSDHHDAIMSKDHCPVLLTRICSSWRHIALNTAALWSSIHIPIPGYRRDQHTRPRAHPHPELQIHGVGTEKQSKDEATVTTIRRAKAIKEWLGRSGSCTLAITVYDTPSTTDLELYKFILDAILPFSERWGSFICNSPETDFLKYISSIPVVRLPRLHTLAIAGEVPPRVNPSVLFNQPPAEPFWANSGILQAPNLRNINYKTSRKDRDNFTAFPLRWGQLTTLSLTSVPISVHPAFSMERIINMLLGCPRLRRCHLELQTTNAGVHQMINPPGTSSPADHPMFNTISLPHLTELIIVGFPESSFSGLLDALEVTNLEIFGMLATAVVFPSLLTFLTRTARTLHKVRINPQLFTTNEFFNFLLTCERLVELELATRETLRADFSIIHYSGARPNASQGSVVLDEECLRRLLAIPCDSDKILLPKLSVFKCSATPDFSDTSALEILNKRNSSQSNGVAKLKAVRIWFSKPQTKTLANELDKFVAEGVDCRFEYPPVRHPSLDFNSAMQGILGWPEDRPAHQFLNSW